MRRKILPLIISAAMAASLVGCSEESTDSGNTTKAATSTEEGNSQADTTAKETENDSSASSAKETKGNEVSTEESVTKGETQEAVTEGSTEESETQEAVTEGSTEESETEEEAEEELSVEEALARVAELNGCEVEELNYNLDDRGYVNFLGAAFTDSVISDAEDAIEAIDDMIYLAGIDGCYFSFYREDVSPVSGFTYYTFSQVAASEEDEDMPIAYSYSQIRIIVDENGYTRGFSADISDPDSITPIDKDNFVTEDEAVELVKGEIKKGNRIISESTILSYWDDMSTSGEVTEAKIVPAWLIYTNEIRNGKPYTMYIIPAIHNEEGSVEIMDRVACSSINAEDDSYTSAIFFEGMEDAGEVTFTLDMTWAYDADTDYQADEEIEVTVPVMYDPESGLYYLADFNENIAIANFYDFASNAEVNALVSEDPEDIDSWHFASMEGSNGEEYYCDMNYILASYDTMLKTYNIYKERYGYNSVDHSGMPILLLVYECSEEYPSEVSEFTDNANSMGQWHDWAVFANSPTYTGCVEVGTMAHEFAHGINSQLTSAHYLNEMGAVMEGYADSIGENLALLYGYKSEDYADYVGSEYATVLRSFSNPHEFSMPKYIGGAYFISPVLETIAEELDAGGVHSNSSVVNYLCYSLFNNEDETAAVLDRETTVDLFVETLYCATYTTGYDELGSYLIFAAGNVDISDEQYEYVVDTVMNLGFKGESEALNEYISEEGSKLYSVKTTIPEELAEYCAFGALLLDYDDTKTVIGMIDDNGYVGFRILEDKENEKIVLKVYFKDSGIKIGYFYVNADPNQEAEINIDYYEVNSGETITLEETIFAVHCYNTDSLELSLVECDGHSITIEEGCIYTASYYDSDNVYHHALINAI